MKRKQTWIVPLTVVAFMSRAAFAQEDPGATGPFVPVTSAEYTAANITLGDVSSEVLAKVHRPPSLSNGPYPLVLFIHGNHASCYNVDTEEGINDWPCTASELDPIPSYSGYDYVASTLASHGMIVASISANEINDADEKDRGRRIEERRQLLQHHLDKWVTFNTTGGAPFGTTFVGKVDLQRIATVGHSRGGQAVLTHANEAPPSGLRAVLAIAPTGHGMLTPLSNLPLAVLLGYCDDDQRNLNGVGYVDGARHAVATDDASKYIFLGLGANHNYFNSVWGPSFGGGYDDWEATADAHCGTGGDRLDEPKQRGFAKAYIAAFLRKHLLGATQFDSILTGDALPPPSAQTTDVFVTYLPGAKDRKDVNRLLTSTEMTTQNTLQGAVDVSGLTATPCGDDLIQCVTSASRTTHWPNTGRLSGLRIEWNALNGIYANEIPPFKRDFSNFATVQFRVAVDYTDTDNPAGSPQDFSIRLTDSVGRSSTLRASDYSDVLYYPPGTGTARAAVMNSLRVPLAAFANVDQTSVASIVLFFDRTQKGRVVVSDIAFAEESTTAAEKWLVSGVEAF